MHARNLVPELMDDPDLDLQAHRQALAGLKRINLLCGTARRLGRQIRKLVTDQSVSNFVSNSPNRMNHVSGKRLSVLDIGSGGGDVTHDLFQYLTRHSIPCDVRGWDLSQTAVDFANQRFATKSDSGSLLFEQHDVLESLQPSGSLDSTDSDLSYSQFDVIYCSLFLHHLTDDQASRLLTSMKNSATTAVIIDDLLRTRMGYWMAKTGCWLLSRSPIVHFDGPQSVRAAFSRDEILRLSRDSGLSPISLRRHWTQRFTLIWRHLDPGQIQSATQKTQFSTTPKQPNHDSQ